MKTNKPSGLNVSQGANLQVPVPAHDQAGQPPEIVQQITNKAIEGLANIVADGAKQVIGSVVNQTGEFIRSATSDFYTPDVTADANGNGMTDAARVGVPAMSVPPPPNDIPGLPNLRPNMQAAHQRFSDRFKSDYIGPLSEKREAEGTRLEDQFMNSTLAAQEKKNAKRAAKGKPPLPPVFEMDLAKELSPDYNPPADANVSAEERLARKAEFNTATHQVGNAVAKRAFLSYLDKLVDERQPGQELSVLVTSGGVSAGKGFAVENVKEVEDMQINADAVWDAAGELNATENQWLLEEFEKRGIKGVFVHVHKENPLEILTHPKFGIVGRALKKGRMVDLKAVADSYAIGNRNFDAFQKLLNSNEEYSEHKTIVLSSNFSSPPADLGTLPESALQMDADSLYRDAMAIIEGQSFECEIEYKLENGEKETRVETRTIEQNYPGLVDNQHIISAATFGQEIWK